MSTPVASGSSAFPQLSGEEGDHACSHIPEGMRVEGSQRRATSRQGMRTEVELSARHDTLISTNSKSSRELETSATSKRDENASKTRKKKPPAVAERFGPAERFVFSGRFGIDPTQYERRWDLGHGEAMAYARSRVLSRQCTSPSASFFMQLVSCRCPAHGTAALCKEIG
jgi:hypothetical protein